MKTRIVTSAIVVLNLSFLVAYALGPLRGEATQTSPPNTVADTPNQPQVSEHQKRADLHPAPRDLQASSTEEKEGPDGKEMLEPAGDSKEMLDYKQAPEPVGELIEAINPGSRPLLPSTEFLPIAENPNILSAPNPPNLRPPVVSPEL